VFTCSMVMELVKVEAGFEDYSFMMFDVCDAMGLMQPPAFQSPQYL
jgi:hypothetical protein